MPLFLTGMITEFQLPEYIMIRAKAVESMRRFFGHAIIE
jgi:hypothetical protein